MSLQSKQTLRFILLIFITFGLTASAVLYIIYATEKSDATKEIWTFFTLAFCIAAKSLFQKNARKPKK